MVYLISFREDNVVKVIEKRYCNGNQLSYKLVNKYEKEISNVKIKDADDYFVLGYLDQINNNNEDAYKNFKIFMKKENKETDLFAKIYSRKYLAQYEYKKGNFEAGNSYIKSTYKLIKENDFNKYYKIVVDTLLVGVDYDENNRILVMDYLNNIKKSSTRLTSKEKFYINYKLSPLYLISGRYAEAIESTLDCISYSKHKSLPFEEAKSIIDLGLIFRQLGRYDIAKNVIKEALEINIPIKKDNASIKIYALVNLADMAVITGDYKEANEEVNEIDEYIKDIKHSEDMDDYEIIKYLILSDINIHGKKLNLAEKYIDKAESLMKQNKEIYLADNDIYLFDTMGELEVAKGNYDDAIKNFNKAYDLSLKKDNKEYQSLILENMCDFFKTTGNLEELSKYQNKLIELLNVEKESIAQDYVLYSKTLVENRRMVKEKVKRKYIEILRVIGFVLLALFIYKYMSKLKKSNKYDPLTNIYNRGVFNKDYNLLKMKRYNYAIAMIDIDNFKYINDTFGHSVGDNVLFKICSIIKNELGKSGNIYRYGGEEFVIIFNEEDNNKIYSILERIRKNVENVIWEKSSLDVTISIGLAISKNKDEDTLKRADINLYKSKKSGKNKITFE